MPPTRWIDSAEARDRLGVKAQTLYAYVSRGLVRSRRVPGDRRHQYDRADVERLAHRGERARGGPRGGAGPEIVVDSALTELDPAGHLAYRGRDVVRASAEATYEEMAEWLWGTEPGPTPWFAPEPLVAAARRAQSALPDTATLADRFRVIAAVVGASDPLRNDRRPESVAAKARVLIAALVDAVPPVDPQAPVASTAARHRGSIAARLWARVTDAAATPGRIRLLDRTLVLLADHELAASTLAARVAASTWADPYLVVGAGLAAAGGPLHAGASESVRSLLREVAAGAPAEVAVGARLRDDGRVAGFGHSVYRGADPRVAPMLESLERSRPSGASGRAARAVRSVVEADDGPRANVDFALGAIAEAHDLVPYAGEAIFVLARCAGWIAHGLEEYPHALRYRIRAAYTGEPREGA